MTDFEKMVSKLREGPYVEGRHFEVWEWENGKQIEFRPASYCDEWITFEYDNDGKLLRIF